uniref:Activating signal cointegrator 1 complex subunit 1-like n=1 Tax=Phallusia mammillata TaxID=59560 RepID=A0A6F9D6E6_9ASCI|nr:activating signal cointegrator 1 complex subunit 1-like [Phallusia mammillata]
MDILNPQLISISGRVYCKYATDNNFATPQSYEEPEVCWDDEPNCESTVTKNQSGRYEAAVNVPSALFKHVIGRKGAMKHKLEQETHTKITIPGKGCNGSIIITGDKSSSVSSAQNRIEILVAEKRWREPFTHFISIPLTSELVRTSFETFRKLAIDTCSLDPRLFQNPQKLHLTICTLVLLDDSEVERAIAAFKKCITRLSSEILGETQLQIKVKGLEYMNDDPGAVDVLYAKVVDENGTNKLQNFADAIATELVKGGLSENQYDHVKLHGTLLNTTFRKANSSDRNEKGKRETFDAQEVLDKFETFDFGTVPLDKICLSARFTTNADGYYDSVDVAQL